MLLQRGGNPALSFVRYEPARQRVGLDVVFLHGLASNKRGIKCTRLADTLPPRGVPLTLFELRGHGDSEGRIEQATIGRVSLLLSMYQPPPSNVVVGTMTGPLFLQGIGSRMSLTSWIRSFLGATGCC